MAPNVADKLSRAKEDVKAGMQSMLSGDQSTRKTPDDGIKPSSMENPLANKGADIEKAAIESDAPTKPTEVSKDKTGNIKRTVGGH
ncbi:hypothetical protein KFE25_008444 [Diacronema lutheri]|uniref:Uncharacterized protein n=1 Tax=Diacronema lutheri TaxID=2081491 RepID=A0A8J6C1A9_DIALT|nr:hypothetical protein KFE25_008444 [Diacronema lutheri]